MTENPHAYTSKSVSPFRDAMPVSFDQDFFYILRFNHSSELYSRKHENLSNTS